MKNRDDYFAQLLRANGDPEKIDKIIQKKCRRKAAKKLAATLSIAPDFYFPTELSVEQCTADDLADFHASLISSGWRVVDLTAGLGIDDFHIARKASEVLSIEVDPAVASAIGKNAEALRLHNIQSICADCKVWLKSNHNCYDIAFIDPARRGTNGERLYSLALCQPNVIELLDDIKRIAPRLIIKVSPMLDIDKVIAELRNVKAVYAVGTKCECKELLVYIDFTYKGSVQIYAVTIGEEIIRKNSDFPILDIENVNPKVGDIVGEPWPSVMKIHPRGMFAGQMHPSTLLFLNPAEGFPGERYRIERVESFSSSALRRLAREGVEASVAVRNFPLTADELRKRLKSKESSEMRLMATTVGPDNKTLMFLHKI